MCVTPPFKKKFKTLPCDFTITLAVYVTPNLRHQDSGSLRKGICSEPARHAGWVVLSVFPPAMEEREIPCGLVRGLCGWQAARTASMWLIDHWGLLVQEELRCGFCCYHRCCFIRDNWDKAIAEAREGNSEWALVVKVNTRCLLSCPCMPR